MSLDELSAAIVFGGVVAYAIFGGADFGSGFWDLTAGGDRKGAATRRRIDASIGPVWEANHVWLIFVLVYLWTAFPAAFGPIMRTLIIPFSLVGVGIIARGAGFAFRKYAGDLESARLYGVIFAVSSVITPFFLGTVAGAIASGRVPAQGAGDLWTSWTGPTSILGGLLAVVTTAFLAATFLAADAGRDGQAGLAAGFRRRGLWSGAVAGAVAVGGIAPLAADAETLFEGLTGGDRYILALSALAGVASLWLLWTWRLRAARVAAVVAVAAVVVGWGVGQYPWILVDELEIAEAAAPDATLWALLVAFGLAAVLAVPPLVWLLVLVERGGLGGHGHDTVPAADGPPSAASVAASPRPEPPAGRSPSG